MGNKFANDPFVIDEKALSQQNALVNLLLSNKDQVEFDLQMALAAFHWDVATGRMNRKGSVKTLLFPVGSMSLNPCPAGTFNELQSFFQMFSNVKGKVDDMVKTINVNKKLPATDFHITNDMTRLSHILYFILFSHKVKLADISSQFNNISKSIVKVFEVLQSKKLSNSSILFHGTSEFNLYSILRNGISEMGRAGVWMTTEIEVALKFSIRFSKAILCFEAQTSQLYDRSGSSSIFEMPLHLIQLRAIVWIHPEHYTTDSSYIQSLPHLANQVVCYLNRAT